VEDQIREARARLRRARERMEQVAQEAQAYYAVEPPPYQAEAAELAQCRKEIGSRYEAACRHQAWGGQGSAPGADGIHRLGGFLASWRAGRQVQSLFKLIQPLEAEIEHGGRLLETLRKKPVVAAERQAKAGRVSDEINRMIKELKGAGLHGAEMDRAIDEAKRLHGDLNQARDWLFPSAGTPGSRQATKEGTIRAWQALERIEAPLEQRAEQLRQWQKQIQEIRDKLGALEQAIENARARLEEAPQSVDVGDLAAALEQARGEARRLAGVSSSPEVGQLASLPESISHVIDQVNELAAEAVEIGRWLKELDATLGRTLALLKQIAARMLEMTQAFPYPIAWGSYEEKLDRLFDEQAEIGEVAGKRTRYRLRLDLDRAGELYTKLEDLSGQVDEVCRHRTALIQLIGRPELAVRPAWLERAAKLAGQTEGYAAENWPTHLAVRSIMNDAETLRALTRQRVPASAVQPLPADGLGRLVNQIQALVRQIEGFQERLEQVDRILAALLGREQAARQALQVSQQALDRVVDSLRDARPPIQAAAARQRQELEGHQRDGKRLLDELEQRSTGQVEQKCGRVDKWVGSCLNSLSAVRHALGTEIEQKKAELRHEIDGLQGLGGFDRVGPMIEANRLLTGRRPAAALPAGQGQAAQRIVLAADEACSLVEERGRSFASLEGIRSDTVEPLRRPREKWEKARQQAAARGEEIGAWKGSVESAWPPLACDIERAEDLLEKARGHEASLGRSETSAYSRELLDKIAVCYEAAIDEMDEAETRVKQERGQIKGIADQIDRWRGQLEAYERAHAGDQAAAQAIESRIDEIDKELGSLRKRWRRTPPSLREAKGALQATWSEVYGDVEIRGSKQVIRVRDIEAMSR